MTDTYQLAVDSLLRATCAVLAISIIWGIAHRLYLSPIARFPGPKIAALTYWYEFYYDAILKGRYVFKIKEMHKKYGPVVRITPRELHIADAEFYSVLYSHSPPRDKCPYYVDTFDFPRSSFGTSDQRTHRLRRGAMNPFFSRGKVLKQEALIQQLVQQLCGRIKEMTRSNQVVPLSLGYTCLATDLINSFIMGCNFRYLEAPDLLPHWGRTLRDASELSAVTRQITWILPILKSLPQSFAELTNPGFKLFFTLTQRSRHRIKEVMGERQSRDTDATGNGNAESTAQRRYTLIDQVLDSRLPPEEKTVERLEQEIRSAIGAGTETTSNALTVLTYHLLANPDKLQRLQGELQVMAPDPDKELALRDLESLPYLSAVILEALRLSYGVSTRLQRVCGDPLRYGEYVIPPGTVVGMSSIVQNHIESVFPNSHDFIPERWVDAHERKRLEPYMVSFSRGSRSLAHGALYVLTGTIFRRFEFELHNTTRDDIDAYHDVFIPRPKNVATMGVQVTAK